MVVYILPEVSFPLRLFSCLHHRIDVVAGHQHREISDPQDFLEAFGCVLDVDMALLLWMLQGVLDPLLQDGPFNHLQGILHFRLCQIAGFGRLRLMFRRDA